MATALETRKRKALRGVIIEIKVGFFVAIIYVRIDGQDTEIASELPKEELSKLNLKTGDAVDIFPIDSDNYLIVNKPR